MVVGAADRDGGGLAEIIVGAGGGIDPAQNIAGPHVKSFGGDLSLLESFFAFDQDFHGGVRVG